MYVECRYGAAPDSDLDRLLAAYSEKLVVSVESDGLSPVTNGSDETVYTAVVRQDDELYGLVVKALTPVDTVDGKLRKIIFATVGYSSGPTIRLSNDICEAVGLEASEKANRDECALIAGPLDKVMRQVTSGDVI